MSNFKTCNAPYWFVFNILNLCEAPYYEGPAYKINIDIRYLRWMAGCGLVEEPKYISYHEEDKDERPYTKRTMLGEYVWNTIFNYKDAHIVFEFDKSVDSLIEDFYKKEVDDVTIEKSVELPEEYK